MEIEELFSDGLTSEIWELVRTRLVSDENLFDEKHRLRHGLTKEQARLVLLVASRFALSCGLKLQLNADEGRLLGKNFAL